LPNIKHNRMTEITDSVVSEEEETTTVSEDPL